MMVVHDRRLDHLRALAALWVFGFHYWHFVAHPLFAPLDSWNLFEILVYHGYFGVSLFIVLSGYLFSKLYLVRCRFDWVVFWFKRLLRIVPPLLPVFAGWVWVAGKPWEEFWRWLLNPLNLNATSYPSELGHLWSINRELQCYAVFPLLWWLHRCYGVPGLIVAWVITMLASLGYGLWTNSLLDFYHSFWLRLSEFCTGVLMGRLSATLMKGFRLTSMLILFLGILAFHHWNHWRAPLNYSVSGVLDFLLLGCLLAVLIMAYERTRWHLPWLDAGLAGVGKISYSFYLIHFPLLLSAHSYIDTLSGSLMGQGWILLAMTLVLATLFYWLVERPALKLKRVVNES